VWFARFAIAVVCFSMLGVGIWKIGELAGCADDPRQYLYEETADGARWLRHPRGFRIQHPGPAFVADRESASRFEKTMATSCDTYMSQDAVLTVCVIDGLVDSRETFKDEIEGARRGLAAAARTVAQRSPDYFFRGLDAFGTVVTHVDDVGWSDGQGTGYLHVTVEGYEIRMKAFTLGKALVVAFAGGNGLAATVDSLAKI
jgi:hypothetical protein